jgi:formylglycine-generating enzyme required for sulfatase activity
MRKKWFPLIVLLFVSFLYLPSCSSDDDSPAEDVVVDPTRFSVVNLDGNGDTNPSILKLTDGKDASLIIIQSNNAWTATSDASWLKVTSYSGEKGSTGVIVGVDKNVAFPRSALLVVTAGSKSHTVTIEQSGAAQISLTANNVTFKMIRVDGGTFSMGSNTIYESAPARDITLSSFYICETEVTNGLWNAVMGELPYDALVDFEGHTEYQKMSHPVSGVTWIDVTGSFLPTLNALIDESPRLPSEAEWEYAAMGGNQENDFTYSGGNTLDGVGWNYYNSGNEKKAVKLKLPNHLGLYDMSGNVSEWCSDWYGPYNSEAVATNPSGPASGTARVVRGGNFTTQEIFGVGSCGVKVRNYIVPGGYSGCWDNSGHPDEPICFRCKETGFRFVISF